MADLRAVVERDMDRAGTPAYTFDDLSRRRDRRGRTQRLTTMAVALVIAALGIAGLIRAWGLGAQVPAGQPEEPAPPHETTEVQERILTVDWEEAARTSAEEGLEREAAPLVIEMPVAPGWSETKGWSVTKAGGLPPSGSGITFERPLALYMDRCQWNDPDGVIEVGPSVDDLVDALVEQPQYGAIDVRDISVDGFVGKEFEMLGAPNDLDRTECSFETHRPWAGRFWMGRTETNRVRVLDVGGERVVMRAVYFEGTPFEGTPEEDVAALIRMLDSVRIEIED